MISHEAEELKGIVDYDMEAFRNEDFGVLMFESLAREMNYRRICRYGRCLDYADPHAMVSGWTRLRRRNILI